MKWLRIFPAKSWCDARNGFGYFQLIKSWCEVRNVVDILLLKNRAKSEMRNVCLSQRVQVRSSQRASQPTAGLAWADLCADLGVGPSTGYGPKVQGSRAPKVQGSRGPRV